MKLLVNPTVDVGPAAKKYRKARRLVYLAWIARDLGHDVAFHVPATFGGFSQSYCDIVKDIPIQSGAKDTSECDAYFCSSSCAEAVRKEVGFSGPLVAFMDMLQLETVDKIAAIADLIVTYAWRQKCFYRPHPQFDWDSEERHKRLGPKMLAVPWRVHDVITEQIHKDGNAVAFLRDDLDVLRAAYGSPMTKRRIGFCGNCDTSIRGRTIKRLKAESPGLVEAHWTSGIDSPKCLSPRDYLRWLSECEATLNFPGDTHVCSHFLESVMMGVPTVTVAKAFDYQPPLTCANVIAIDDWETVDASTLQLLCNRKTVREGADEAYRSGWSLRGLFHQILKRLERA